MKRVRRQKTAEHDGELHMFGEKYINVLSHILSVSWYCVLILITRLDRHVSSVYISFDSVVKCDC